MAIKYASRIAGAVVAVADPSWTVERHSPFTVVRRSTGAFDNWVHHAIPTAVLMDGDNMKALSASVRFQTGSGATVQRFHVGDGEITLFDKDFLGLKHPTMAYDIRDILNDPVVRHSVVVSLRIEFDGTGQDDWIMLGTAGVDFDNA